jgi:Flp pilus assembly protein TadG
VVTGSERGSVTVEAAIGLSTLVVVLALCVAGLAAMVAQVRTTDAAGEAARLAARGDDAAAHAVVDRLAPSGSELRLTGSTLVTAQVVAPPLGGLLPGIRLGATAVAMREPAEP